MSTIKHEHYIKSTRLNGVSEPDETVDRTYVENYIGAKSWFEDVVNGTEEHKRLPGGVLTVKATSPDGAEVRETIFTPVRCTCRAAVGHYSTHLRYCPAFGLPVVR